MRNVVSFSGGKDSTCMLLMMLENGMEVDDIVFADTGKEFPQLYEHIEKVEKYINRKVTVLKAVHSYDYYMIEKVLTKGPHAGTRGYGWASMKNRWCTSSLKTSILDKYERSLGEHKNYIGIAYDEQKRIKDKCYPLIDWRITEKMALQYCYDKGFDWGGLYEYFRRVSCYLCPLQRISEWRTLRHKFPNLWADALRLDKLSPTTMQNGKRLADLDRRFAVEDLQTELFK